MAYLIRFNFQIPEVEIYSFRYVYPVVIGIRIISFAFAYFDFYPSHWIADVVNNPINIMHTTQADVVIKSI